MAPGKGKGQLRVGGGIRLRARKKCPWVMFAMCVVVRVLGSLIIMTPIPMSYGHGSAFMDCTVIQEELYKHGSLCFI